MDTKYELVENQPLIYSHLILPSTPQRIITPNKLFISSNSQSWKFLLKSRTRNHDFHPLKVKQYFFCIFMSYGDCLFPIYSKTSLTNHCNSPVVIVLFLTLLYKNQIILMTLLIIFFLYWSFNFSWCPALLSSKGIVDTLNSSTITNYLIWCPKQVHGKHSSLLRIDM